MTNGEKFKEVFKISQVDEGELYAYVWLPNHDAAEISIEWWNAEYQEPTTKNDLGVDCISRQAVEDAMYDATRAMDLNYGQIMEYIDNLPSVTPQLSSGLDKNSKKLDCISRADAIHVVSEALKSTFVEYKDIANKVIGKCPSVTPQEPRCKECKWWKDSDGEYRRGCGAESQCPINRREVYEGNGYCFLFEPQEREEV